jgi:hypothetical protein
MTMSRVKSIAIGIPVVLGVNLAIYLFIPQIFIDDYCDRSVLVLVPSPKATSDSVQYILWEAVVVLKRRCYL